MVRSKAKPCCEMPSLSILFNRSPPLKLYLGFSVLLIFIASNKRNLTTSMEHISNSTSLEPAQSGQIVELLDEDGTFIVANTICCGIVIVYKIIQCLVLGTLRVSEQQHLRDSFWDYLLQKGIFVILILDAKDYRERLPWVVWFTTLGSILLLSRLCKDRFEYLSSSPATKRWTLIKISILMSFLLIATLFCNAIVFFSHSFTYTLFLLADATYILTFVISILSRFLVLAYDMRTNSVWENRATIIYYGDLLFATLMSTIDLLHHSHLLIISHFSMLIRGWCLLRIHTLVMEIRRRYRRHKNYLLVVKLMETNFSMASPEDIDKNSDYCAICWEVMDSARKLPCGHLFHNSCLRSWLEQDTSCPKCRTSLKGQQVDQIHEIEDHSESEEEFIDTVRLHQRNHLFHFDSSRYTNNPFLSWLPTISIEGFM